MATRKQRRREAKAKRHEYEFVYVDAEGNEVDDVPGELEQSGKQRDERRNGSKPVASKQQATAQRGRRTPPEPSWNSAFKRAGLLGIVVFVLFSFTAKSYASALPLAALYTIMFIPFTYLIDRFAYRRWQARQGPQAGTPAKKR
jgi:hypothetical protein